MVGVLADQKDDFLGSKDGSLFEVVDLGGSAFLLVLFIDLHNAKLVSGRIWADHLCSSLLGLVGVCVDSPHRRALSQRWEGLALGCFCGLQYSVVVHSSRGSVSVCPPLFGSRLIPLRSSLRTTDSSRSLLPGSRHPLLVQIP